MYEYEDIHQVFAEHAPTLCELYEAQETQRASYVKHAWRRWRRSVTTFRCIDSISHPLVIRLPRHIDTHLFLYFAAPYFSPYHESEAGLAQTAEREINSIAAKRMYVTFQSITESSHLCFSMRHISYPHKLSHSYGLHLRRSPCVREVNH